MQDFLFYFFSGLCVGAIYALIALGYTLVYGIIKLINFAHGEFYMVGAYAGFAVFALLPTNTPLYILIPAILIISGFAGSAIAVLTESIAYKPIRKNGRLAALLTAIGVSFFLQTSFAFINNAAPLKYSGALSDLCNTPMPFIEIKAIKFIFIFITIILTGVLWFIVMKTSFGRAMRAVSLDAKAAALMGIDIDAVIRKTFIIGGFLAGIGGSLVGFQGVIEPMMGFMIGLKAFIAAVLGGIGSITGAVLGGILLGIIEYMVVYLGVPSGYKDIAAFVALILVLLIRPQGILGKVTREKV